jgi:hypothetical protein
VSATGGAAELRTWRWVKSSAVQVPSNAAQVTSAWFAGAALAISLVALVLALLSWRAARRSAAASERSAGAAESNAAIAVRNEQRQAEQQHDAAGPRFEIEPATVYDRAAKIKIRVVGGPSRTVIDVRADDVPWCRGVSDGSGTAGTSVRFPPAAPGDVLPLTVHLTMDPWQGHTAEGVALSLVLDVESREDPPRHWRRPAQVQLIAPPPAPVRVPATDRLPDAW